MKKILILKQNLKELAGSIRKSKVDCKQCQREHQGHDGYWEGQPGNGGKWVGGYYNKIDSLKYEFRHKHIAYCLIRGRTRDEIERPAEDNQPCESYIKEIQNAYTEDVCVGTIGS
jgi:hypothetical protein